MGRWAAPLAACLLAAATLPPAKASAAATPLEVAATLHRAPAGHLLTRVTLRSLTRDPLEVEVEVEGTRIARHLTLPGLARRHLLLLTPPPPRAVVVQVRAAGEVVRTAPEPLPPIPPRTTVATGNGRAVPPGVVRLAAMPHHWAPLLAYGAWLLPEGGDRSGPAAAAAVQRARHLGLPVAEHLARPSTPLLPPPPSPPIPAAPAPLDAAVRHLAALLAAAALLSLVASRLRRGALPALAAVILAAASTAPLLAPPTRATTTYRSTPPLRLATLTAGGFGHGPLLEGEAAAWSAQAAAPGLRWVVQGERLVLEQVGPLPAPVRAVAVGLPDAPPFREVRGGG